MRRGIRDFEVLWTWLLGRHTTARRRRITIRTRCICVRSRWHASRRKHNPSPLRCRSSWLILAPLGGLNRAPAYAIFMGAGLALYALASIAGRSRATDRVSSALSAAPSTGINLIFGQSGFLSGGLILGGLAAAPPGLLVAGALVALTAYKPQLAVLLPVALIAAGLWRTIAAAAATLLACALATTIAFGAESGRDGSPRWPPIRRWRWSIG